MSEQTVSNLWFIFSISLNALGNSFMVIAQLGSAPWTSAAENLVTIFPPSIGVWIIILHILSFIISYTMKNKLPVDVMLKSIGLAIAFGLLIDLFLYFHELIFVPDKVTVRYLYLFIGMNFISIAISIYFQSSSIYLPTDFLLKAFGRKFSNFTVGTIIWTAIPLSISLVIVLYRWEVIGIGPGTILFMFINGILIDMYNHWIIIRKAPQQA